MAKPNKISTPSSVGGIVRYFQDEDSTNIMLRPEHIIAICAIVGGLVILLNMYGPGWFGF